MRRDVLRFSGGVGLVLLLTLVLVAGCTRAKSSGPPEPTSSEAASATTTQPSADQPTFTPLSGDAAINATARALAATATAEAQTVQDTQVPPTDTPQPTESAEPTTPAATAEPQATELTAEATTPVATTPATTAQATPSTGAKTHTVQSGENLFRIALKYGLTYQQLAAHNGIANPNFILAGQVLKIPGAGDATPPPAEGTRYHTVQVNENLFRVALKYNMLYTRLAQANGLSYPYTIYPGQRLVIP